MEISIKVSPEDYEKLRDGIPHDSRAREANLPLAKQTVDILGMLREKTRGNLTQEEAQLLDNLLYDLRMKYVDAKKR